MAQAPGIRNLSAEDFEGPDGLSKLIESLNPLISSVSTGMNKGLTLGANMNAIEKEFDVTIPPTDWTTVSAFDNSWTTYSADWPVRYRINDDGLVTLTGMLKSGTITASAFTLPSGYRPAYNMNFAIASNGAFGVCYVEASTGKVTPYVGSNVSFNLDTVSFYAKGPAPVNAFVGPGWPANITSGQQGPIHDVKLITLRDLNGTPANSHGGAALQWEPGAGGNITVRRITRLTPERTYRVKVLLFPTY
jgi:hypothetical protein